MPTDSKLDSTDKRAKPPAKRRWFQFSLWGMFVWVTVIAVLLAAGLRWIAPAQQQRAAVEMIERVGGNVTYAEPPADEGWLTAWLRAWLPRDYFDSVDSVELIRSSVADADLRLIANLTQLQYLWLDQTKVTDSGLAYLAELTQLESLTLNDTQVTDAGLAHLAGLKQLQTLWLNYTQVTDAGLEHLSGLTQLQCLNLNHVQVKDAGLIHLSGLTQLQLLVLDRTHITNAGLKKLQKALPDCQIEP